MLRIMENRIGKLMTIHEALYPKNDIDKLHMIKRKKKGIGLDSTEECVDTEYQEDWKIYQPLNKSRMWTR